MVQRNVLPGAWALLMVVLMSLVNKFTPVFYVIKIPFTNLGFLFILVSAIVGVWAAILFRRRRTTIMPAGEPTSLVTGGPFNFSRNPMYLSFALALLGIALLFGSLTSFIFPIIFVVIINRMYIPMEERKMEQVFGKEYVEYKKRVRKWL